MNDHFYKDERVTLYQGDCLDVLRRLPSESVHCCVTSPPYFGLRDYGTASWDISATENTEIAEKCDHTISNNDADNLQDRFAARVTRGERSKCLKCGAVRVDQQIGLEASPQEFIAKMVEVFEEVRRVLRSDGTLWLNLGDSYASNWPCNRRSVVGSGSLENGKREARPPRLGGLKDKDLMGIPWRVAFALQEAGWWLRSDLPWVKRSAMPESVQDRPAKALEYVFLLTKSPKYFFDMQSVRVEMADSSVQRLSQNVEAQAGSDRVPGKTNGNMKAVGHVRDRSLPQNRNGITDHLDNTPAGGRNFRNSDLFFSSIGEPHGLISMDDELVGLDVNPSGFKEAHFATFPSKLVEPLIKASTSEKGVCAECGKAWERLREPSEEYAKHLGTSVHDHEDDLGRGMRVNKKVNAEYSTIGWQKTCKCETDDVVPATVLEPFAGAGTTLLVAKRLGRCSVGAELNPEYCRMIQRRLEHWHRPSPPPEAKDAAEMPLFDEVTAI